jgi:lipoprotein-releasing system ATP-binding protein
VSEHSAVALRAEKLGKSFETGQSTVHVLQDVALELQRGESLGIIGPSGSGKSTLLHILGTLDRPSTGSLSIDDRDPFALDDTELARFRNSCVGFVFQEHHLLPQYTLLENTLLPALAFPDRRAGSVEKARALLERVGLHDRLTHRPAELSGGERQRAAVARALMNSPSMLLCDEPTGNLDAETAERIGTLLCELHEQEQNVLIVVTHSLELAKRLSRRVELKQGRLSEVA